MKPGTILLLCFLFRPFISFPQDTDSTNSKPKLFQIHGSILLKTTFYNVTGTAIRRQQPFSWYISGSPQISIKGFHIPLSAFTGEAGRYYGQPFTHIGASPKFKWLTLHAGYRNLHYSPFTLAGHSFLGTAVEANPGKLRASFMYGRMQKAIGEDRILPYDIMPAYRRMGYAFKIGYEYSSGYIDFSMFRAKDDTASRRRRSRLTTIAPEENLATGIQVHQAISKKITWDADVAISALNHDLQSPVITLLKMKWLNNFGDMFRPRTSVQLMKAAQTTATYQSKKFNWKIGYKRIEPGYKSLGAYYMQSDLEDYQLSAATHLFSGKLNLRASIGRQHDNLKRTLLQTTKRTTASADISFTPSAAYAMDLQYFNFGVVQQTGINPLYDSIRVAQANHHFSTTHRFSKISERQIRNIFLILTYQELTDLNPLSVFKYSSSNTFLQCMYAWTLIPAQFSFNGTVQWTGLKTSGGFNSMKGVTISVSKGFSAEARLSSNVSLSCFGNTYQSYINGSASSSSVISSTATVSYRLRKKHSVTLDLALLRNYALSDSFAEFSASAGYGFRF